MSNFSRSRRAPANRLNMAGWGWTVTANDSGADRIGRNTPQANNPRLPRLLLLCDSQRVFDVLTNGRSLVFLFHFDPQERQTGGGEGSIDESVTRLALGPTARNIVELDCQLHFQSLVIADDKVDVLAEDA